MSFFLVPIIGTGARGDAWRPKYVSALGVAWSMVDFGDSAIAWAAASPAQETSVAANSDATLIPPLDNTVAVNATKNALEALNMPAQWVTGSMTYRTVLRITIGMAQLIQRVKALGVSVVLAGNLDKTMAQLSATVRNAIATACDQLGIDRTNIVASTTLRAALQDFGQQFTTGRTVALGDL